MNTTSATRPATADSSGERALYNLLAEIIDYAGLFPPALLDLKAAIRNFARYQSGDDAWMLNRFIIPASRLEALYDFEELFSRTTPLRCSVLATGADDSASFLEALEGDLDSIAELHALQDGRMRAEAMEARWPAGLLDSRADALGSFLDSVALLFEQAGLGNLEVYLELPLDDRTSERMDAVLQALAHHDRMAVAHKIRCGGDRPEDHPDPNVVAPVIIALRDAGVPFKATAGLHHPVRHFNRDAGAHMLGFLNVFGAAILAAAHDLNEEAVLRILEDENPAHFQFDDDAFEWMDLSVTADEITDLRRFATTFGSCSFDEPREDLQALGLSLDT